jgi:hypothetical protein
LSLLLVKVGSRVFVRNSVGICEWAGWDLAIVLVGGGVVWCRGGVVWSRGRVVRGGTVVRGAGREAEGGSHEGRGKDELENNKIGNCRRNLRICSDKKAMA